jgi:general secretion pathway protein E
MANHAATTVDNILPLEFAKQAGVVARLQANCLEVFYAKQPAISCLLELRRHFGVPLHCKQLASTEWQKLFSKSYALDTNTAIQLAHDFSAGLSLMDILQDLPTNADLLSAHDDAPIIRLINALLQESVHAGASDVHIDADANSVVIRYRIDGVLRNLVNLPRVLAPLIASRLKVMAKLDITEKRLPQDGHFNLQLSDRVVDVRLAIIATHCGERLVLRLLDQNAKQFNLNQLGMSEATLTTLKQLLQYPHGMILVTGPTGSGKTTTLYAMLAALHDGSCNIISIEDPVEYAVSGISQIQVNNKVNFTFATALRAILRQDPDIIMIGEIRDLETAEIAIRASLTGHLVLATLHTNSALAALSRLQNMGISEFLLAASIRGVVAQRLIRLLCVHCKYAVVPSASEQQLLGNTPGFIYQSTGCENCQYYGYLGRQGIYELIIIDEQFQLLLQQKVPYYQLEQYVSAHYASLQQDGYRYVKNGCSSMIEVQRLTAVKL